MGSHYEITHKNQKGISKIYYHRVPTLIENEIGELILKTKPEVLHAESNAIAKLAKSTNSGLGATLFVTHSPCIECAKLIYQSGISSVYYNKNYRDKKRGKPMIFLFFLFDNCFFQEILINYNFSRLPMTENSRYSKLVAII